ncbi:MAG: hypothetical protein GVY16_10330 [Planctomycetes bacterium]|jgi:hypothetical protein|nr:hypothetical protein [Planctomycetota bacterium]
MHRYLLLLLLCGTVCLAVPAAAQDGEPPIEPPTPVEPIAGEPAPPDPAPSDAELARTAGRAEAIAKLAVAMKDLQLGDIGTLDMLVGDAWPMLLAAMAVDPITQPADADGAVTVVADRSAVLRWLQAAKACDAATKDLAAASLEDLTLDEPLSVSVTAKVPGALTLSPLITDPNAKVPEPPLWKKHVVGQGRLLAERAARADAMKRLAERLRDIAVNDTLRVQDFIANSDQPDVDPQRFLRGAKTLGLRCREDALVVEVVVQGSRRAMLASLTGWADAHYKGEAKDLMALRASVEQGEERLFHETGTAMPPRSSLRGLDPETIVRLGAVTGEAVPAWATLQYCTEAAAVDPAAGILDRAILADCIGQAWNTHTDNDTPLSRLALDRPAVGKALILAALMRQQESRSGDDSRTVRASAVMPMQPAWRLIAAYVLSNGPLPGMTAVDQAKP